LADFMRNVFADAQYFVALINDEDQSHPAAQAISQSLQGIMVLKTENQRLAAGLGWQ
jgi:hypothetical protein